MLDDQRGHAFRAQPLEQLAQRLLLLEAQAGRRFVEQQEAGVGAQRARDLDVMNLPADAWDKAFAVNARGPMLLCKHVLPTMIAGGGGSIIHSASGFGLLGEMTLTAYGASKAAVSYFADSLRLDLADSGISVHLIEPGFVDTPLTQKNDFAMPFLVTVEQAAERIFNGLQAGKSRIRFPRRLSCMLKLLSVLPYNLRNKVAQRMKQQ